MSVRRLCASWRLAVVLGAMGAAVSGDCPTGRGAESAAMGPLRVHPDNSRWLADPSGKAVFLTGSHTWANRQERGVEGATPDFDYAGYLDFLTRYGHNFIRLWAWEHAQWMQFVNKETPIRYKPSPYERPGPGAALDGKPKFDLHRFNSAYFHRLRRRVEAARDRRIYVSVMLFQGFSLDKRRGDQKMGNAWLGHPMNAANNISGVDGNPSGDQSGREVHTLAIPEVTALQEAYVRKVIETVGDLDNVLWEIGNECHQGSVPWQVHMIRFIKRVERDRDLQHPVGMTGAPIGEKDLMRSPADWVSPPGRKWLTDPPVNDGRKVVIVDTDHCDPWHHDPSWPWRNLLRGNQFILMDGYVDFRLGCPSAPDPKWNRTRRAMGAVRSMSEQVDLAALAPHSDLCSTGFCLATPGETYLAHQPDSGRAFQVRLEAGRYDVVWIDVVSGAVRGRDKIQAKGGAYGFSQPRADVVLLCAARPGR